MAKNTAITVTLIQDFAGKKSGDNLVLSKEIAMSVVKRGFAKYENELPAANEPAKEETKVKTSKSKKK